MSIELGIVYHLLSPFTHGYFFLTESFILFILLMNNLNDLHVTYLCISILLSGFAFYFLIEFIYIYFITGRKVVINHILAGTSTLLYVTGDTAALLFLILTNNHENARIFILIRELSLLLFMVSMPFTAGRLLALKNGLLKFNKTLFGIAIVSTVVIISLSLYRPELMIGDAAEKSTIA